MNFLCKTINYFFKITSSLINTYLNFFKKNISSAVITRFDECKNNVFILVRGSRGLMKLKISEVIFDSILISRLSPSDAANLGYCYGINYLSMKNKSSNKTPDYSIFLEKESKCKILFVDRKRNIVFTFGNKSLHMSPIEIIERRPLLNEFDSVCACYIGIQAGILNKTKKETAPKETNSQKLYLV